MIAPVPRRGGVQTELGNGPFGLDEVAARKRRTTRSGRRSDQEVVTAWDLGIADQTAIVFAQVNGPAVAIIDFYHHRGESLAHYAKVRLARSGRGLRIRSPRSSCVRLLRARCGSPRPGPIGRCWFARVVTAGPDDLVLLACADGASTMTAPSARVNEVPSWRLTCRRPEIRR
jgi:hypothetical protein